MSQRGGDLLLNECPYLNIYSCWSSVGLYKLNGDEGQKNRLSLDSKFPMETHGHTAHEREIIFN